jgi:anti-anti-sigma factor
MATLAYVALSGGKKEDVPSLGISPRLQTAARILGMTDPLYAGVVPSQEVFAEPALGPIPFGARLDIEVRGEVLCLRGELTLATKAILEAEVDRLIENGLRYPVFDLAELKFMDASGINSFIRFQSDLEPAGGFIELRHPTWMIRKVLDVCGLTRLIRREI